MVMSKRRRGVVDWHKPWMGEDGRCNSRMSRKKRQLRWPAGGVGKGREMRFVGICGRFRWVKGVVESGATESRKLGSAGLTDCVQRRARTKTRTTDEG